MSTQTTPLASTQRDGRRRLQLAFGVAVIVAAVAVVLLLTRGTPGTPSAADTTTPEHWSLPRLEGGGQVSLAQFEGHPLVADFFASWCTSCRAELPDFVQVSRSLSGRIAFVGIDSEENGDGLGLARATGITAWPLARDVGGSQLSGLRDALESIPGMPITAFYDARGHLLTVRLGALTADELTAQLHQLYGTS